MSVPFEADWGFARRASRDRMDPPSESELRLFSPTTSGPGRVPLPLPLPLPLAPRALRTSFRSFRETALEPDTTA